MKGLEKGQKEAETLDRARGTCRECEKGLGKGGAPKPGKPGDGSGAQVPRQAQGGEPHDTSSGKAGKDGGGGSGMAEPTPDAGPSSGGDSDPGSGKTPKLYPFKRLETEDGATLSVPGQVKGNESKTPSVFKDKPTPDQAAVPYTDLLPGYKSQAEDAIRRERVPPGYRKIDRKSTRLNSSH